MWAKGFCSFGEIARKAKGLVAGRKVVFDQPAVELVSCPNGLPMISPITINVIYRQPFYKVFATTGAAKAVVR